MNFRKITGTVLGISMVFTMYAVPVHAEETPDSEFDAFLEDEFREYMEQDYTTLHYTLKDYESLGIKKPDVNIGTASWSDYASDRKQAQSDLKKLQSFDYDSLSDKQKTDYKCLEWDLKNTIALNKYPYFDFAFSREDGVPDSIVTTFTEFVFYKKEDIDDYLTCLKSVPDYLDDCMKITRKQADQGYFLTSSQLKNTEEYINDFTAKKEDNALIQIFNENIDAFEGLSDEEKQSYKDQNREIVLNQFIPAYEKVNKELEKLKGKRKGAYNVASLKDGREYYAALAREKTSMSGSVQDMLDVCTNYLNDAIPQYYQVMQTDDYQESVSLKDPDQVLQYLQNHLQNFPQGPQVTYKASYLDKSVANDSVVAYYMEPPIDDLKDNVIKINGDNISDVNDLYTTLAHEGFPGHLFQKTYFLNTNPAHIRSSLNMIGYQEGWGQYAMMQALDVSGLNADAIAYNELNTGVNYVLDAAVDLGVNGLDWSTSDVSDYLEKLGLNGDSASSLYDFVTSEPGTILPYGVGFAAFEEIEAKAKQIKGNNFNLKKFNTVLLDGGDRPFDLVEKDVNNWLGIDEDTDLILDKKTSSSSDDSESLSEKSREKKNRPVLIGIGVGIAAIGCIALVVSLKYRKDDPFQ